MGGIRRAVTIGLVILVAGCSLLTDAGDPATWLPTKIDGKRISYQTHGAATFETRPVCACDDVITAAGGSLRTATITRGSYGSRLLVMAVRARDVAPADMLQPMLDVGMLEQRGRTDTTVGGRAVTVLTLPSYTTGKAYLAVERDTLLLIHADSDDLAFAYVRALP
jgi:hypothetical protein